MGRSPSPSRRDYAGGSVCQEGLEASRRALASVITASAAVKTEKHSATFAGRKIRSRAAASSWPIQIPQSGRGSCGTAQTTTKVPTSVSRGFALPHHPVEHGQQVEVNPPFTAPAAIDMPPAGDIHHGHVPINIMHFQNYARPTTMDELLGTLPGAK
jgi:hypothetical protein